MASTTTSSSSTKPSAAEKAAKRAQEKKEKEEKNAAKRRHDYVPKDLKPQGRLISIHSKADVTHSEPGRVIKERDESKKPRTEPNRGCRTGRMGFWVEKDGEYKAAFLCKRKVCDYDAGEGDDEEHEFDGEESEGQGDGGEAGLNDFAMWGCLGCFHCV